MELEPQDVLVVPPDTPHGFRNIGDVPLHVVSVHERGTLRQTWLGQEPCLGTTDEFGRPPSFDPHDDG